jgi:hypothetical protein
MQISTKLDMVNGSLKMATMSTILYYTKKWIRFSKNTTSYKKLYDIGKVIAMDDSRLADLLTKDSIEQKDYNHKQKSSYTSESRSKKYDDEDIEPSDTLTKQSRSTGSSKSAKTNALLALLRLLNAAKPQTTIIKSNLLAAALPRQTN